MAKAKSKLNRRRHQLRIPIEYKKKYAEIFSKDSMRISYLRCLRSEVFKLMIKARSRIDSDASVIMIDFLIFEGMESWYYEWSSRTLWARFPKNISEFKLCSNELVRTVLFTWDAKLSVKTVHLRETLKTIYDTREAILDEPLSKKAYKNRGLRLRTKLSRTRKSFEDRLAAILCNFSSKMNINFALVPKVAKAWI